MSSHSGNLSLDSKWQECPPLSYQFVCYPRDLGRDLMEEGCSVSEHGKEVRVKFLILALSDHFLSSQRKTENHPHPRLACYTYKQSNTGRSLVC